jgi:hypothetical protein
MIFLWFPWVFGMTSNVEQNKASIAGREGLLASPSNKNQKKEKENQ